MDELRKGTQFSSVNLANTESSIINPKDLIHDREPTSYYGKVKQVISQALRNDEHKEKSFAEQKQND